MNYSYKGKILISTPDLSGDIFSRSVVLIVEHSDQGAYGFILNKKNYLISQGLSNFFKTTIGIYEGGPVEKEKVSFIVKGQPLNEFYIPINSDYHITEDTKTVITALTQQKIQLSDIKVFSGYSGWSPMQLEHEISRKLWTVVDLSDLDYTSPNDERLWKQIMKNLGGEFLLWANAPNDISMN